MADIDRLPREWAQSFHRAHSASEAALNSLTVFRPDYHTVYTHFLGDVLPDAWGAGATNGTAAAVTVASSQLTCTSGTDDNGYAGQGHGLFWSGDNGFYMESFQAMDDLTTQKFEVGVTDSLADAGAVNVKATPSATATDFAVLVFDTDDNTQLDLISQDTSGVAADAENVYTVVAGTNFRTEFRVRTDTCAVFVNGDNVGGGNIQGGTSITPWFFTQSRAAASSGVLTVEYLIATGPNGLAIT